MDAVAVKTNKGGVEQEFWRLKPKKKKKTYPVVFWKQKRYTKHRIFGAWNRFRILKSPPKSHSLQPKA